MTVLNHGLSWDLPGDVELVRERILEARMAAEGPLHELGAIADRELRLAGHGPDRRDRPPDVPAGARDEGVAPVRGRRRDRGPARRPGLDDPDDRDDTARVLRYLAKVTIEPAIMHGLADHVGSLRAGPARRHRPLVARRSSGSSPTGCSRAGSRLGPVGEGNASLERAEPTRYRADWGGLADAAPRVAVTFVSSGVDRASLARRLGTRRVLLPVARLSAGSPGRRSMPTARPPQVDIDVRSGAVSLGGRPLAVDPVTEVPLSRRYLLR